VAGSRFVRADLHVHTVAAPNEGPRPPVDLPTMIATAKARGLSVLGITDHNGVPNARAAAALSAPELLVLPGIEISTTDGHLLALFAPDQVDELEAFARDGLALVPLSGGGSRSKRSAAELVDDITARHGLPILAHIDTADGLMARGNAASMANLLTRPGLAGLEITRKESRVWFSVVDDDPTRRSAWNERVRALGPKPLARIMSSDAHTDEDVGADQESRTLTRLRLDELTFHAVRLALQRHPEARCRLEVDLGPNYPRATAVTFSGGFLDGLRIELSPNLTCLIGSRGSGKTTALRALRAALGEIEPPDDDSHPNMPDETRVEFVDGLGSTRVALRRRYGTPVDEQDGTSPIALPVIDLEQNFGMEFLDEDPSDPVTTMTFLGQFIDTTRLDSEEVTLEAQLGEKASTIRSTSTAASELAKARKERNEQNASLKAAADAKLELVATYARVLAAETPLLRELEAAIKALGLAELPDVPSVDDLAAEMAVDLTERPASDFVEQVRAQLIALSERVDRVEELAQKELVEQSEPIYASLKSWREKHEKWEQEIEARRKMLEDAGLSLQVAELDRIRNRLGVLEGDIKRLEAAEKAYAQARTDRAALLESLNRLRERRHAVRQAASEDLARAVNKGSSAQVAVTWERARVVGLYGERLGQVFNLRSPRSERMAAAISPGRLAELGWRNDEAGLGALSDTLGPFVPDPKAGMKSLRTFDNVFEFETMRLEDRPQIRVRFQDDPTGPGRPLRELSLGQARSVLLGFLLASPSNEPLILDQPEDQLDGPFLADTVVAYLHAAKERRQVVVATHNPNLVVLGDAELVLPLRVDGGRGAVVDAGSVDNAATRAQVIRLLEGGAPAFRERAFRYGLQVEDLPV
jgi:energy-coupling factor transporter ATP-binding protein EcfA2